MSYPYSGGMNAGNQHYSSVDTSDEVAPFIHPEFLLYGGTALIGLCIVVNVKLKKYIESERQNDNIALDAVALASLPTANSRGLPENDRTIRSFWRQRIASFSYLRDHLVAASRRVSNSILPFYSVGGQFQGRIQHAPDPTAITHISRIQRDEYGRNRLYLRRDIIDITHSVKHLLFIASLHDPERANICAETLAHYHNSEYRDIATGRTHKVGSPVAPTSLLPGIQAAAHKARAHLEKFALKPRAAGGFYWNVHPEHPVRRDLENALSGIALNDKFGLEIHSEAQEQARIEAENRRRAAMRNRFRIATRMLNRNITSKTVKIQSIGRMFLAKQARRRLIETNQNAAIRIQSFARMRAAQNIMPAIRASRKIQGLIKIRAAKHTLKQLRANAANAMHFEQSALIQAERRIAIPHFNKRISVKAFSALKAMLNRRKVKQKAISHHNSHITQKAFDGLKLAASMRKAKQKAALHHKQNQFRRLLNGIKTQRLENRADEFNERLIARNNSVLLKSYFDAIKKQYLAKKALEASPASTVSTASSQSLHSVPSAGAGSAGILAPKPETFFAYTQDIDVNEQNKQLANIINKVTDTFKSKKTNTFEFYIGGSSIDFILGKQCIPATKDVDIAILKNEDFCLESFMKTQTPPETFKYAGGSDGSRLKESCPHFTRFEADNDSKKRPTIDITVYTPATDGTPPDVETISKGNLTDLGSMKIQVCVEVGKGHRNISATLLSYKHPMDFNGEILPDTTINPTNVMKLLKQLSRVNPRSIPQMTFNALKNFSNTDTGRKFYEDFLKETSKPGSQLNMMQRLMIKVVTADTYYTYLASVSPPLPSTPPRSATPVQRALSPSGLSPTSPEFTPSPKTPR